MNNNHNNEDHSKLNAIYTSLDSHNYQRALKHTHNPTISRWTITRALRVHCLERLGLTTDCLSALHELIGGYLDMTEVVRLYVKVKRRREETTTMSSSTSVAAGSGGKGTGGGGKMTKSKKQKKKKKQQQQQQSDDGNKLPSSNAESSSSSSSSSLERAAASSDDNDWMTSFLSGRMNRSPPLVKYGAVITDKRRLAQLVITDETTLATIAITLRALSLPHTLISLYTLPTPTPSSLRHLFESYLRLPHPPLPPMQRTLVQLSKITQEPKHYANACHMCLMMTEEEPNDEANLLYARLAEGLLKKKVPQKGRDEWKLYLRSLTLQKKYPDALAALATIDASSPSCPLPREDVWDHQSTLAMTLKDYPTARSLYRRLWTVGNRQWRHGTGLVEAAWRGGGREEVGALRRGWEASFDAVGDDVERGRFLMLLECSGIVVAKAEEVAEEDVRRLREDIASYGSLFAPRVSCCFDDLSHYLTLCLGRAGREDVRELRDWAKGLARRRGRRDDDDDDDDEGEKRRRLRCFITGCRVAVAIRTFMETTRGDETTGGEEEEFPTIEEMMGEWRRSLKAWGGIPEGGQKENHPGDELIFLIAHQLLPRSPLRTALFLEYALAKSPHNPSLKLHLLLIYQQLPPSHRSLAPRALALYDALDVKQIQLDSLSYLILPTLLSNGYYEEVIALCRRLLSVHETSGGDISTGIKTCYENGFYEKAEDMLKFRDETMRGSLQLLAAKGVILQLAPLVGKRWGDKHGLTGLIPLQYHRARRIIDETHDSYGAPSLLQTVLDDPRMTKRFRDNRDVSLLPSSLSRRVASAETLQRRSYQRGATQLVLILVTEVVSGVMGGGGGVVLLGRELEMKVESLEGVRETCRFLFEEEDETIVFGRILVTFCDVMSHLLRRYYGDDDDDNNGDGNAPVQNIIKNVNDDDNNVVATLIDGMTRDISLITTTPKTTTTTKTPIATMELMNVFDTIALFQMIQTLTSHQQQQQQQQQKTTSTKSITTSLNALRSSLISLIKHHISTTTSATQPPWNDDDESHMDGLLLLGDDATEWDNAVKMMRETWERSKKDWKLRVMPLLNGILETVLMDNNKSRAG